MYILEQQERSLFIETGEAYVQLSLSLSYPLEYSHPWIRATFPRMGGTSPWMDGHYTSLGDPNAR